MAPGGPSTFTRVSETPRQRTASPFATNVTPSAPPWAVWQLGQPSDPRAASALWAGRVDGWAP